MLNPTKEALYSELLSKASGLIDKQCGDTANLANIAALLKETFNFWWCGFYMVNANNQLELGPFQGPVACTLISYGNGVCGSAWKQKETIIVPDVHQFEGHIACSSVSNSEIVVPFFRDNNIIGVLDIDSEHFNHFDQTDQKYLEALLKLLN
ncbi:MAG: GAF domain-containing protein [Chitinophagaceae bacterium]